MATKDKTRMIAELVALIAPPFCSQTLWDRIGRHLESKTRFEVTGLLKRWKKLSPGARELIADIIEL